jgi:Ala-tRNA(Pro) deacylase
MNTFEKIKKFLTEKGIEFKTINHQPTTTSQASAEARGEDLKIGGKALVMKTDDVFRLFVLSAAKKTDSKRLKRIFGCKRIRFANGEELQELTGLVPGAVPPFGRPIVDLDLYVDRSIAVNPKIAFNAGSLTDSIVMKTEDYLSVAEPEIIEFSKE